MVRSCCICKREAGMEEDATFHSIPTRVDVRLKWFDAIGREVSKNTAVCSKHFHGDDIFYTYMKDGSIRRRLRPGAIPTLHLMKEMLRHESTIARNKNVNSENPIAYETNRDSIKIRQVHMDKKDEERDLFNLELTIRKTHETGNIQEEVNTAKRKSENEQIGQKRCRVVRYPGDFCRDDFTSDHNWQLFRKYYEGTSQKLRVLQERDRRKTNQIKTLKNIILTNIYFKNNGNF